MKAKHGWKRSGLFLVAMLLASACIAGCGEKTDKVGEAMNLVGEMDYQGALVLFEEAAQNHEDNRLVARGKGIAYLGQTKYDEAIDCFLEALSESNGIIQNVDYDLNYYLASAYAGAGRFEEARETYDAILALKPQEKDAYYLRGGVELELNLIEEAKQDYDKAVSMDPKNYDRLFAIYEAFAHFGHKDVGKTYLQTALENGEKTLSAFDKGRLYYFMEEYERAYDQLEEAKADEKAESSLYLGKAYEATGAYNYACNVYRSYLERHGDSAEMYNQLGVCEMKRGNYDVALEAFISGLELQDKDMQQSLMFNQIVAYEYLGHFASAENLMQDYLRQYPGDEEALREEIFLSTRCTFLEQEDASK